MEVVVTGSLESSANSFLSVSELQTGSHIHTFKQSAASRNAVSQVGATLFVSQNDKSIINVYRWHKEAIDQKIIVPDKLETISASHDGTWLLGGSASGKLYLWEIASGNLLFVKDAHYRAVTTCTFANDDLTIVTGSADATVQVWRVHDLFDPYTAQELIKPVLNLSSHTLPVTQVHVGMGSSASARLYSASLDQTIRIWDLATGEALTTLLLPSPVTCMAVDPAERHIFAGTQAGIVHEVRLYKKEKVLQVIGDRGTIVSVGQTDEDMFSGHEAAISALALSLDGSVLCSGAEDGSTFVWSVANRQMTRKLKQQPAAITVLQIILRPSQESVVQKNQNNQFQPFKRAQTERDRDEHNIFLKLTSETHRSRFQPPDDFEAAKIGLQQLTGNVSHDPIAQETITKLQDELKKVYGTYSELRVRHEQLNREYISSQI